MAISTSDPLIGRVFDGRYLIARKLGAGGMANVYLAEDQELGRRVAIKILNDRHANDEQFVERFRREAKNAAGLSHPNIVSIFDRGEAEGTYYIAMEYLDGRSVKELIVRDRRLAVHVALDNTRQILAAVGHAHRGGLVHRDIKPHNVLLAGEGRVKVTDFGIARSGASQMTEAGSIIGTAQYLSPEQARGASVDARSDIYSVGVVLYEMLTGTVPYAGDTPLEIAMKHLSAVPEPPSRKRSEVPRDLDSVVLRALAKNPEDRYQSAEEMDADLARVARGIAVVPRTTEAATAVLAGAGTLHAAPTSILRGPPPTAPTRPRSGPPYVPPSSYYGYTPPRRPRIWPWLLAVLFVAGAAVGGWYLYKKVQNELNANKPVHVDNYVGIRAFLAVKKIKEAGLTPRIERHATAMQPNGFVYAQAPNAGESTQKGNSVRVLVSTGPPRYAVPYVVGKPVAEAVLLLANAHLRPRTVEVNSSQEPGTVTAQAPKAGATLLSGSRVRVNVSKGPKPVVLPPVVGLPFDEAASRLRDLGFVVSQTPVDSREPQDSVLRAIPPAGSQLPRGTKITLLVSKGPTTVSVPDVTALDQGTAEATLSNAGFRVTVEKRETADPAQDGIVLGQDPAGGTEVDPGTPVTLSVGAWRDSAAAQTTATDTTSTSTAPTDTTATDTAQTR